MKANNPLESVYFISLPENFKSENSEIQIDPTVQLPVQKKPEDGPGDFDPKEITTEQILAGILTVLAYDKKNQKLD